MMPGGSSEFDYVDRKICRLENFLKAFTITGIIATSGLALANAYFMGDAAYSAIQATSPADMKLYAKEAVNLAVLTGLLGWMTAKGINTYRKYSQSKI